ncbi:hypothetical protein PRUPE_5G139300 [Prunus persica]|uniref:Uncharacterized protein n=1 Tax=Prunus persica TaxID=3760 RepID=A0A251P875_PRUPE|nr:hypothetical protein PRUPE_5G139300 [Prunus persica]
MYLDCIGHNPRTLIVCPPPVFAVGGFYIHQTGVLSVRRHLERCVCALRIRSGAFENIIQRVDFFAYVDHVSLKRD